MGPEDDEDEDEAAPEELDGPAEDDPAAVPPLALRFRLKPG